MSKAIVLASLLVSLISPLYAQNVNAHLCQKGSKSGNVELLSSRPTSELIKYLNGLKSGEYSFNWGINGFQAAAQLGFGKRFSATYGQMVEQTYFLMQQNGVINIKQMIDYLNSIIQEERTVDALTIKREQHFSSIVYLRALQVGECAFPYVLHDSPTAQGLLVQLQQAYPDLVTERTNAVFANIYNTTVASAQVRIKKKGSVSIYRDIEDWRDILVK